VSVASPHFTGFSLTETQFSPGKTSVQIDEPARAYTPVLPLREMGAVVLLGQ
jgi:hypothetical protein